MNETLGHLQLFPPKTLERLQDIKHHLEEIVFRISKDQNNSQSAVSCSISTLETIIQEKQADIDKIIEKEEILKNALSTLGDIIEKLPQNTPDEIIKKLGKCYGDILRIQTTNIYNSRK